MVDDDETGVMNLGVLRTFARLNSFCQDEAREADSATKSTDDQTTSTNKTLPGKNAAMKADSDKCAFITSIPF
jgi:hypothetical protein